MPTTQAHPRQFPLPRRTWIVSALSHASARKLHRLSATIVGSFGVVHLLNHLAIPWGPEVHTQVMVMMRPLYRGALTEPVLLASVAAQTLSGLRLLWIRRTAHSRSSRWQRYTGAYLSFFLVVHTVAALVQRHVLGLETNFHWAAAVVLTAPLTYFFVPYYLLGVLSFLMHLRYAVRRGSPRCWLTGGLVLGLLIVAGLGGLLFPIDLPAAYRL